jgi:branched-chain amino acid aminotransferase
MGTKSLTASEWIWKDGEFVRWEDATVHILSTAVQFGSSIFEGMRAYETPDGPAIFRLHAHLRRFQDSARIYRMPLEWSIDELAEASRETVQRNELRSCYVRPMSLWGYGAASMDPTGSPFETYVCAWAWGEYLGEGALERGVDACVSSWQRAQPNTYPSAAKAAGHYTNSQLIRLEALKNGYDEGIALSPSGLVSEGSGMNLFLVRDGVVFTPFLDGSSLAGITRSAIIQIAHDLGFETREQDVPRETLYTCDEMFFTGTATEVTPIRSVDRIPVGEGKPGPVTRAIQERYLDTVNGRVEDTHGWLTHV